MVPFIETDFEYPELGRVRIEDTVVVTPIGPEGHGDLACAWTIVAGSSRRTIVGRPRAPWGGLRTQDLHALAT